MASANRGGGTTAPCHVVRAGVSIRARRCRFVRAIFDEAVSCVLLLVNRRAWSYAPDMAFGMDSTWIDTAVATSAPEGHAHVES